MVGITTWRAGEVVWILKEWRTGRNLDELVEKFRVEFPGVTRNSLHKSITYVWQKYSKDPSYNHKFLSAEIAVIMEQHFVHKVDLERIVEIFQAFFPNHDWNRHVDRRTAIDCVVGKFGWDHATRCVLWGNDEISFVLRNRLKLKSWERLFEEFQAWTTRRDVTLDSLQYLCLTSNFYHLEIKEGLENHYQASLNSFDEESFTEMEDFYDISDWKRAYYDTTNSSLVKEVSSTKRKREVDSNAREIESKEVRQLPPEMKCDKRSGEVAIGARSTKPSTNQFVSSNVLSSVAATEPCGSLIQSQAKPHSQLSRARTQNMESLEALISGHHEYAPKSNSSTSTIQVHSLETSKSQYSGARCQLLGVTLQNGSNHKSTAQNGFTRMRIGELGIEHSLSDQESISSSRQAPITQNYVAELPARVIVSQANIKARNDQDGHTSAYIEDPSLGWQEHQLECTKECFCRPTKRARNQYDIGMEYSPSQNQFIPLGYPHSTIGVKGKRMLPWTNSDLQPIFADSIPSGNLNAQPPGISSEHPIIYQMGIASPYLPDTNPLYYGANSDETVRWQTLTPMQAPRFKNPRNVSTNHVVSNDTVVFPSPIMQLVQDPFPQHKQLLDPALFDEPNSISIQQRGEGNCFQQVSSMSAQATNLRSESLLHQSSDSNIKSLPIENMEAPLTTGHELASIDFRKVHIRRQDEVQLPRANALLVPLNCITSDDAKGGGLLATANPSVPRTFSSCEANQHDYNSISDHRGFTRFEITYETTSALNPSPGIDQQLYSYLGQDGSSPERPIIIMEAEYNKVVPAMQEWGIYSATPLYTLSPSGEDEPPMFEPDPAVLSEKDRTIGEHDVPDILQEVAALGEILLSQNKLCPPVVGDNH